MEIHILDWIIYFVIIIFYWYVLDKGSDGEFTNELGSVVGCFYALVITVIYCAFFWVNDWIDIFKYLYQNVKL